MLMKLTVMDVLDVEIVMDALEVDIKKDVQVLGTSSSFWSHWRSYCGNSGRKPAAFPGCVGSDVRSRVVEFRHSSRGGDYWGPTSWIEMRPSEAVQHNLTVYCFAVDCITH